MKTIKFIIPSILITLILFLLLGYFVGVRINWTKSYPRGLYYSKVIQKPIKYKGQLVELCVNPKNKVIILAKNLHIIPPGQCPGDLMPFLKKLVAVPGDTVSVDQSGVKINGHLIQNSRIKYKIFEQFVHNGYQKTLKEGEFWVMSNYNPNSLDSRYFGIVNSPQIKRTSRPLYLIEQ